MEFRQYAAVLGKRWRLVAAAFVVGVLGALVVAYLTPATYRTDTQLFVSTRTDSSNINQQLFQGGSFSVDRVKSYAELATSPKVLEPVIEQLGLGVPVGTIAREITATAPSGTVLLELQVTDRSAATAAALVNAVGAQLGKVIEELETPSSGPSPVKVTSLKQAVPPTDPVWPSVPVNLVVGVLAGLIVGIGLALLLETLDVTVKSRDDIARVTDIPVLASVVNDAAGKGRPILRDSDPHSLRGEAYRQLRTNMQFAFVDDKPGVVSVTSAIAAEGKSSVTGNLALSMQQLGMRVCLIDGDLRRPSVATYLGLVGDVGLTTVLIGRAEIDEVVQTAAPGLDVITSGTIPPNPSELLASERMKTVLRELAGRYDLVLIDSPPTLPVADAAVLASRSDGVLLVVHAGRTTRHQVELALRGLAQVNARMLGAVLNMVPSRAGAGYYDYSYSYRPQPAGQPEPLPAPDAEQTMQLEPVPRAIEPEPAGQHPVPHPISQPKPRPRPVSGPTEGDPVAGRHVRNAVPEAGPEDRSSRPAPRPSPATTVSSGRNDVS